MLKNKEIPSIREITWVYGIVVLLIYGWTIYWFLWKLPSWLFYLTITEILTMFCYSMMVNFLESLTLIVGVVCSYELLPKSWMENRFVSTGAITATVVCAFLANFPIQSPDAFSYAPLLRYGMICVIATIGANWIGRNHIVANWIDAFAERTVVFLYLSIPISAISMLVVLIRNLY